MTDDCDGEFVGLIETVAPYSMEPTTTPMPMPMPAPRAASTSGVSDGIRELIEATASVFGSGEPSGDDDGYDDDADDDDADDDELAAGAAVPEISRKVNKPRIRTRRNRPRSKTIALKRLTRAELQRGALANPPVEGAERPVTRSECADGQRPCPWVACKHHLYLDINPRTGSIKINFPDLEPWELQQTCALDVADNGGLTLEEIGLITNLTRERVRQVEVRGLLTLKASARQLR